jgi:hypothetical protein
MYLEAAQLQDEWILRTYVGLAHTSKLFASR